MTQPEINSGANATAGIVTIASPRLDLVWLCPAFMQASLAGRIQEATTLLGARLPDSWPDDDVRRRLVMRRKQMAADPSAAPWLLRAIVCRAGSRVAGLINFHGPPDAEGRAELGYTVFEGYRRRGFATEAATAMMAWARQEHGIRRFLLSISPGNEASLGLAAKLGFNRIGTQIDEIDGEEYVFELEVP